MQFDLVRLSLLERKQIDTFEQRAPSGSPYSREEWLRVLFGSRIEFIHRKEQYHYVPVLNSRDTIIYGRIGRQIVLSENAPPDDGLEDTSRESWQASTILLDPRPHADGQKAAI